MRPAASPRDRIGHPAALALASVVAILWTAWALWVPLYNASAAVKAGPGHAIRRSTLLMEFFPGVIPGLSWERSGLGVAVAKLGHVENLPQRLPIAIAAAFLVASGLALGGLILRSLGLHRRWPVAERIAIGFGLGMAGLGLFALLMGRAGWLSPWSARAGLFVPIVAEVALAYRGRAPGGGTASESPPVSRLALAGLLVVVGPFLVVMALGSMLPTIDFDAIEYHLAAPKEYFLARKITFLPHNVYASMPFGVEMLHLLGMQVADDWWSGALVGQAVIAAFAPMAGLTIWLTARRWGSSRAAWAAAVVYLTTPWIYRLAAIPYVEGPLCYVHAALALAAGMAWGEPVEWRGRAWAVVGGLAGGAMAIKYPALISAVVPFGVVAMVASWRGSFRATRGGRGESTPPPSSPPQEGRAKTAEDREPSPLAGEDRVGGGPSRLAGRVLSTPILAFSLGVVLVMAPWLAKNIVDTGNPVYPLAYRVFGGRDWDDARERQWSNAHGPRPITGTALADGLLDVAGRSDWLAPAIVALAPMAFLRPGSRRIACAFGGYVAYLFATWWLFTHRLDRFWLPLLPALAVLAGLGADWTRARAWTALVALVLTVSVVASAAHSATNLVALNDWTGDLRTLRKDVPEIVNPPLARLDAALPPGAKPLIVGQAQTFHMNHPVVYNTVFDRDIFESIDRGKSPEEVRAELNRRGITHLYVDWSEVDRYRSPGNYGFTDYVTPGRFDRLVRSGVLSPPTPLGPAQVLYAVRPAG